MRFFAAFAGLPMIFLISRPVAAAERYVLHEKLHVGQVVCIQSDYRRSVHSISTTGDVQTPSNIDYHQILKSTISVLAEKDGSATEVRVQVDASSRDIENHSGNLKWVDNNFAGKTITLRRLADDSIANDFTGQADPTDLDNLNAYLNPDADCYPDHPVAVGDVWDATAKMQPHSGLGPNDHMLAECRLDSVKNENGRQMAQITCSCGEIFQEDGNVEEDVQWTAVMLTDIGTGQIISSDLKGSSTYSTPATESTRLSGGTTFHDIDLVIPPTTRP